MHFDVASRLVTFFKFIWCHFAHLWHLFSSPRKLKENSKSQAEENVLPNKTTLCFIPIFQGFLCFQKQQ